MVFDKLTQLSDTQILAATAVSTNSYDLGTTIPRDVTAGEELSLVVHVKAAAAAGGTYMFQIVESADPALAAPNVLASRIIAAALLTAGSVHEVKLPKKTVSLRYLGANYVLGGATPSVTVSAYIVPSSSVVRSEVYPRGFVQV